MLLNASPTDPAEDWLRDWPGPLRDFELEVEGGARFGGIFGGWLVFYGLEGEGGGEWEVVVWVGERRGGGMWVRRREGCGSSGGGVCEFQN